MKWDALMTPSPIIIGLRKRFTGWKSAQTKHRYHAFTTAFDEVIDAAQLPAVLPTLSPPEAASFDDAVRQFDALFAGERVEIAAGGAELVRSLQRDLSAEERADTVVSFLIDHSGSMRGLRMLSALLAVEGSVDALAGSGIATEIVGFTTVSWKGGNSSRAWRWAGRPKNPGRLCDLRHIVYGAADRGNRNPWHLRYALRSDMLHENVDGEALLWAASRLDAKKWKRRVICLVSDGAPVDDATLLANDDQRILVSHLEDAEAGLTGQGFVIGTLLIGGEKYQEPTIFERAEEPQAAGVALLRLVGRTLSPGGDLA